MSERLINGGAENGQAGWEVSGLFSVVNIAGHPVLEGDSSFQLRKSGESITTLTGRMDQTVILTEGETHVVTAWVYGTNRGGSTLECRVDRGDGGPLLLLGEAPRVSGWQLWNVGSFVAVGSIGHLVFRTGTTGPSTAAGYWLLDSLSLDAPFPGTAMASRFQVVQALRQAFTDISLANGYHTAVAGVRFQTPRHADGQLAPPTGPIVVLPAYREDEGPGTTSDQGLTDERWTQAVVIIVPRPRSSDPFDLLFMEWLCHAYDDMLRVCLTIESTKLGRLVQEITTQKVVWDADTPKPWGSIYFYLQIHEMRERQQLGVA